MSIYIKDDTVVLVDGNVATDVDCCCETGACCFDCDSPEHTTNCDDVTESECSDRGGTFQGIGTSCDDDPAPCPELTGACCVDDVCSTQTENDCADMGGTYQGDCSPCDPNPCNPSALGACCTTGNTCLNAVTAEDCASRPGVFLGEGTSCPDPPTSTPGPCCLVGDCEGYNGECAGTGGFNSGEGCYCTATDVQTYDCYVERVGEEGVESFSHHFEFTGVIVYDWEWLLISGVYGCWATIQSNTCSCILNTHFFDGTNTTCDCCIPGCGSANCFDAGGIDCPCDLEITGDTTEECDSSLGPTPPPANATCSSHEVYEIS